MVTYFIPSLEMFPYSQYAIQRIPWNLILYHHMKCVITIYDTKDTMVTYFMPSYEIHRYSHYAIQRIPWYLILYHHLKCFLTHNMQ